MRTQVHPPLTASAEPSYTPTVLLTYAIGRHFRGACPLSVADEIERALILRIRSGQYPADWRLPSVRELARQFGVNKNTVNRVYRSLASQGYVCTVVGKGVFVNGSLADEGRTNLNDALSSQLVEIAWRARLLGLSADETRDAFEQALRRTYSPDFVRVIFVECNRYDAETLGRQVEANAGIPISFHLLQDFKRNTERICRDVDLVTTTFYHLATVRDAVQASGSSTEVVGIHAPPETEGLLRIARAPGGSRVVVVCTEETTLNTIVNQVRTYNSAVSVSPFLVGRDSDLQSLLLDAHCVIDTNTSHEAVIAAGWQSSIVTVHFAVDRQSTELLSKRIHELIGTRLAAASTNDGGTEGVLTPGNHRNG